MSRLIKKQIFVKYPCKYARKITNTQIHFKNASRYAKIFNIFNMQNNIRVYSRENGDFNQKLLKNRLYSLNVLEYGIIIANYCKKLAYCTS